MKIFIFFLLLLQYSRSKRIRGNLDEIERYSFLRHDGEDDNGGFTNEWIVRIVGDEPQADYIAFTLGYENLGPIDGFEGYYLMKTEETHSLTLLDRSFERTRELEEQFMVLFAQQLFDKKRVKRDIYVPERFKISKEKKAFDKQSFNDELWYREWYLQDDREVKSHPDVSLRVLPVYEMGYSGKGVRIVVLDDGIEWKHADLIDNYDSSISYDYNNGTYGDPDPTPRYPTKLYGPSNSHGTRCAGEISMSANNEKCGVGVAWNSRIGGIRMLDGSVNDRIEGLALKHALDKVDIYTASWGPTDDGKTVEGPGVLAQTALEQGVEKGRNGKGAIYVWAAGNGGIHSDNCNCDGYTSSIYTVSIGSASDKGQFPWYGESCSSTLASTFSSGARTDKQITTTDTNNSCTNSHTGTSAAAPLAAGILALALEANPNLTWRDVQHLIVRTSRTDGLDDNEKWQTNGAGYRVNAHFGFGILDAHQMVKTALSWRNVSPKAIHTFYPDTDSPRRLEYAAPVDVAFTVEDKSEINEMIEINYLEHVQVRTNIRYTSRGALEILLRSPSGTYSPLLTARKEDVSDGGFRNWSFMSVHFWGENPRGTWTLIILDRTSRNGYGFVDDVKLSLHGIAEKPAYMNTPKEYEEDV